MSLINCPSCQKKVSDKASVCSNCDFSFIQNEDEVARLKTLNFRKYRDTMYRLKMLMFLSIAIAVAGLVPMLWSYAKAIDYGFNANILNHWGIYLVMVGFAMYVMVRVLMFNAKRNYKSQK